ncbi:MAG: Nitrogen regulation protein [Verrucomicrobiota bacterium]|jgi:DNA-binding NarL/FixJ family response regulator
MIMNASVSSQGTRFPRIFVVEENALIRLAVRRLVAEEPGWTLIGESGSSRETLSCLQSMEVDVVILELATLDGAGMDLIQDLHLRHPRVRILVLSSHSEELFAHRALHAGADGFISKGEPLDTIRSAIAKVANGETYISPEASARFALKYLGVGVSAGSSKLDGLSNRELQVFRLLGSGQTTRSTAEVLGISVKTVETHIEHLKRKLGVHSGAALIHKAVQWMERGLLQ